LKEREINPAGKVNILPRKRVRIKARKLSTKIVKKLWKSFG
jgi:hypothetical protein